MPLDPTILHRRVRAKLRALSPSEWVYLETIQALSEALSSSEKMDRARAVLDLLLDSQFSPGTDPTHLDRIAARILTAARGVRDASPGVDADRATDDLQRALDEAARASVPPTRQRDCLQITPALVHPSLATVASRLVPGGQLEGVALAEPQRLVAETLIDLLESGRRPDDMTEYLYQLNAILDHEPRLRDEGRFEAQALLLEHLRTAHQYAYVLKTAQSGMACDNALMGLECALDDAREISDL